MVIEFRLGGQRRRLRIARLGARAQFDRHLGACRSRPEHPNSTPASIARGPDTRVTHVANRHKTELIDQVGSGQSIFSMAGKEFRLLREGRSLLLSLARIGGFMSTRYRSIVLAGLVATPALAADPASDPIFADGFDRTLLVAPFMGGTPQPADLAFNSRIDNVDMYVILDRSGSMSIEITTVKNNLATVVNHLTCAPSGTGDPGSCVADLWAGAGTVGYSGSGIDAYRNWVDVQPSPNFAGVPTTEPGGCCQEPLTFSIYATITGNGGTDFGFTGVPARASCGTSPAAIAGFAAFGYPCFRQGALPIVLLATDEQPLSAGDTNKTPDWTTIVLPQMLARGARFIGILGSTFAVNTDTDLRTMATDTGAVDSANANAPLVFDGSGANAATAIENGVRAAVNGIPLRVRAVIEDDTSDSVDAVAAFVDHIQTLQLGTPECTSGLSADDSGSDGFPDRYSGVRPGIGVCWRLVPKANTTVPASTVLQMFHAIVRVTADVDVALGTRDIYFLVPPQS
jgi:hypothetical protein